MRLDGRRVENSSPARALVDVDVADAYRTAHRRRVSIHADRDLTPAERRSPLRLAGGDPDRVLAHPFDEVIVLWRPPHPPEQPIPEEAMLDPTDPPCPPP
jgi:hypothetical protein